MPDYEALIDPETWAFIRRTQSMYPENAVDSSVQEQRRNYDAMCRAFFQGYPNSVSASDHDVNGVPVRWYVGAETGPETKTGPVILYLHGGGYVVGGLESHDDVCAELCAATGFDVISADYRLAPEHHHPAAYQDAQTTFDWLRGNLARPVILCGDSAGGCLAAGVAHRSRNDPGLLGQVLIYPGLGAPRNAGSSVLHADAPMLTLKESLYYQSARTGGDVPQGDPTFAPLQDRDFSGLPPSVVITAQCDPLASNGPLYCQAISDSGGQAVCIEETGLVHGFLRARHSVTRARDSFSRIILALAQIGAGSPIDIPDGNDVNH